jgi:hypothetical protein
MHTYQLTCCTIYIAITHKGTTGEPPYSGDTFTMQEPMSLRRNQLILTEWNAIPGPRNSIMLSRSWQQWYIFTMSSKRTSSKWTVRCSTFYISTTWLSLFMCDSSVFPPPADQAVSDLMSVLLPGILTPTWNIQECLQLHTVQE